MYNMDHSSIQELDFSYILSSREKRGSHLVSLGGGLQNQVVKSFWTLIVCQKFLNLNVQF